VRTAAALHEKAGLWDAILRNGRFASTETKVTRDAEELLELLDLKDLKEEQARNLPYGDQRRLEIARALATKPQLLLLDEPAAGMNPQESGDLMRLIRRLKTDFGLTILADRARHDRRDGRVRNHHRAGPRPAHRARHARAKSGATPKSSKRIWARPLRTRPT
jgi:ABC-type transporter Mla maintaining outer membrane lipid asymmetry ATPase subunit MlaF